MKCVLCGLFLVSLASHPAMANGFGLLDGSNFTAPNYNGVANVENPQIGDIVFDASANNFSGFTGTSWIQFGAQPLGSQGKVTSFNSSGTFTTQSTSSTSTVYSYLVVGAGGGSGGCNTVSGSTGMPGAAGGIGMGTFTGLSPNTAVTITIGAGGAAGTTSPSAGGAGGTSTIGSPVDCSCAGGSGGGSGTFGFALATGGTCSGCSTSIPGSNGTVLLGGNGPFGGAGSEANYSFQVSTAASNYGAGAGSTSCGGLVSLAGGLGGGGFIVITQMTP